MDWTNFPSTTQSPGNFSATSRLEIDTKAMLKHYKSSDSSFSEGPLVHVCVLYPKLYLCKTHWTPPNVKHVPLPPVQLHPSPTPLPLSYCPLSHCPPVPWDQFSWLWLLSPSQGSHSHCHPQHNNWKSNHLNIFASPDGLSFRLQSYTYTLFICSSKFLLLLLPNLRHSHFCRYGDNAFDQRSPRPPDVGVSRWHGHTYRQTDLTARQLYDWIMILIFIA